MKLIDPDELERVLRPILKDESCPLHIAAEIDMNLDLMLKVDAVPVVHGQWIGGTEDASCSVCNRNLLDFVSYTEYCGVYEYPNFCPNCGAWMDGKI